MKKKLLKQVTFLTVVSLSKYFNKHVENTKTASKLILNLETKTLT